MKKSISNLTVLLALSLAATAYAAAPGITGTGGVGTFNLTAGPQTSSVGELVELATAFFERPAPRLIEPRLYRRVVHPLLVRAGGDEHRRRAVKRTEAFFPYFDAKVVYDDRRARVALRGEGISPTPLRQYFDRLAEFALQADWGRRQISRASLAESADGRPRAAARPRAARIRTEVYA